MSAPSLPSQPLKPGHRLGRYQLILPIAQGGMALVWAARLRGERGFTKLVAIKTAHHHLAAEPQFERLFLDEALVASKLHHANVCQVLELGEEERTLYIVMEWVHGDSLARLLEPNDDDRAEPIEPRMAARLVAEACAGLHSAHEATDDEGVPLAVVHRDVSPHNILVSLEGRVKVADFGIAKSRAQLHFTPGSGEVKGKLAYMAPEQLAGGALDRRVDVFALGCVLYEATVGKKPFQGPTEAESMYKLLEGRYEPPGTAVEGYPRELAVIVDRALARSADDRYGSAEQMRLALEGWLAREGPPIGVADIAALVRERIGARLDQRRTALRDAVKWLQVEEDSEISKVGPASHHHRATDVARAEARSDPFARPDMASLVSGETRITSSVSTDELALARRRARGYRPLAFAGLALGVGILAFGARVHRLHSPTATPTYTTVATPGPEPLRSAASVVPSGDLDSGSASEPNAQPAVEHPSRETGENGTRVTGPRRAPTHASPDAGSARTFGGPHLPGTDDPSPSQPALPDNPFTRPKTSRAPGATPMDSNPYQPHP